MRVSKTKWIITSFHCAFHFWIPKLYSCRPWSLACLLFLHSIAVMQTQRASGCRSSITTSSAVDVRSLWFRWKIGHLYVVLLNLNLSWPCHTTFVRFLFYSRNIQDLIRKSLGGEEDKPTIIAPYGCMGRTSVIFFRYRSEVCFQTF